MQVKVDMSKVVDNSIPLDPDTYTCLIKKAVFTLPKGAEIDSKGNLASLPTDPKTGDTVWPWVQLMAEITMGPMAGRSIFGRLTTNPDQTTNGSSKNYLLYGLCKVLGLADSPSELNLDIDPKTMDCNDLVNKAVNVVTTINEQKETGDKFTNIKKFATAD